MVSHDEHRNGGGGECGGRGGHSDGDVLVVLIFFFDDFFLDNVVEFNSKLPGPGLHGLTINCLRFFHSGVMFCSWAGIERAETPDAVGNGAFTAVIVCVFGIRANDGFTGCFASVKVGNSVVCHVSLGPKVLIIVSADDCFFGSDGANKEGNGVFHLFGFIIFKYKIKSKLFVINAKS